MITNEFKQMEMAKRLKKSREAKKLTISALADSIGVSRSLLSKIEKGERNLSIEALVSCSKIFGVSTDYLLGLETYDSYICEEAYFSTYSLEETKEKIVDQYVIEKKKEEEEIDEFFQKKNNILNIPSELEMKELDDRLNRERFHHTKKPQQAISYMLFLIKNYYRDDYKFFESAGMKLTDEDFELLRLQLGIQFLDEKKYFKNTVFEFIKNAPELNKIYKLINEMDSVTRKYLENFLNSLNLCEEGKK
jgi:transcriptional regulator with XRE-family HTH domain